MRTALVLSIVTGCGSPSAGVSLDSGPLIAMTEGDPPRHIHVSGASTLTTDVPWATFDRSSGDLVLDPPCTTVPGTSGAPRLFYMELDATAIAVQVQPSAAGSCAPSLVACTTTDVCTPSTECAQDQLGTGPIMLRYPRLTDPDESIVFSIANPDPTVGLAVHLTTDAPLKFKSNSMSTSVCSLAPNSNIVGAFTLDWGVATAPGSADSPLVASGEYRLDWNANEAFGLEVESCAGDGDMCLLHRYTQALTPPAQWCIDTVNHGAIAMTLGLRLWLVPAMDSYTFDVTATLMSGNQVTLTSSQSLSRDTISVVVDRLSFPGMLTAELGVVDTDMLTLVVDLHDGGTKKVVVSIMPTCPTQFEQIATAP